MLELWQQSYQGELLILLPDTFGTTQFLRDAPDWVADWTGQRMDSKDPFSPGTNTSRGLSGTGAIRAASGCMASDALDVDLILGLHAYFGGTLRGTALPADFQSASDFLNEKKWSPDPRIRFSAGWGTLLTNDFRGCNPQGDDGFDPVSLVCKLSEVEGRPAVKLSDNYSKALGDPAEIERYRRIFGTAGVADVPVIT